MHCEHCGNEVSLNDTLCPWCDAPLTEKKSENRQEARGKAAPPPKQGITVSIPVALTVGVIVVAALTFLILRNTGSPKAMSETVMNNQWSPQVVSVAKQFTCPCGTCTDNLLICNCDDPGGAFEAKTFIQKGVQAGKTPDQMVQAVALKYHLTPIK